MTKNDDLWPEILTMTPRLKDPDQIRVGFEMHRPLDRYEYRAHRNIQADLKAAEVAGESRGEPQFKIKKNSATFATTVHHSNLVDHIQGVRAHLGDVQRNGLLLAGRIQGRREQAIADLDRARKDRRIV